MRRFIKKFKSSTWRTSMSCTTFGWPWHCLRRRISVAQSTRFDTILTAYSLPLSRSVQRRHTLKLPSPKMDSFRSRSYRWKNGEFCKKKRIIEIIKNMARHNLMNAKYQQMAFRSVPTTFLFRFWSVWHQRTLSAQYKYCFELWVSICYFWL